MVKPDFQETIDILSLESARAIIKSITSKPKTVREIFDEIKGISCNLKYRTSVFKSLEKMVSAGLVEKIEGKEGVRYQSKFSEIDAHLINEKLDLKRNGAKKL